MARKPSPKGKLTSGELAEKFAVELPERYRKFIDSGEYEKWNGKKLPRLPGYSMKGIALSFDSPKLRSIFRVNGVDPAKEKKIPLAVPKGTELCVLTLDVSEPSCPVGIWEEGTFLRFLPSFDKLLEALAGKLEPSPIERLEKARDEAGALVRAGKHARALPLLEAAIGDLTPTSEFELPKGKRYLSQVYNLRGLCLDELDKPGALESYEAAMACGTEQADYAALNFLRWHLERKKFAVVIEKASELAKEDLGEECDFFVGKYLGLAQLDSGNEAAARKTLLALAKRFRKDSERMASLGKSLEDRAGEGHAAAGKLLAELTKKK